MLGNFAFSAAPLSSLANTSFASAVSEAASGVDTGNASVGLMTAANEAAFGIDLVSVTRQVTSLASEAANSIEMLGVTRQVLAYAFELVSGKEVVLPRQDWMQLIDTQTPGWAPVVDSATGTWQNTGVPGAAGWTLINTKE